MEPIIHFVQQFSILSFEHKIEIIQLFEHFINYFNIKYIILPILEINFKRVINLMKALKIINCFFFINISSTVDPQGPILIKSIALYSFIPLQISSSRHFFFQILTGG